MDTETVFAALAFDLDLLPDSAALRRACVRASDEWEALAVGCVICGAPHESLCAAECSR